MRRNMGGKGKEKKSCGNGEVGEEYRDKEEKNIQARDIHEEEH